MLLMRRETDLGKKKGRGTGEEERKRDFVQQNILTGCKSILTAHCNILTGVFICNVDCLVHGRSVWLGFGLAIT